MKNISYTPYIIVFTIIFCMLGCNAFNRYFGLDDDWLGEEILEEAIETVIKAKTGLEIEIDLTPESPED